MFFGVDLLAVELPPIFEGLVPSVYVAVGAVLSTGILLFVISYFAYFPTKNYLENRKKFIKDNIDNSLKLKSDAQNLFSKASNALEESKQKSNLYFNEIKTRAIESQELILKETKEKANLLYSENLKQIEIEKKIIEDKLKKDFVDISIQGAEKIIKENLNIQKNRELLNDFLEQINSGEIDV